jgi:hypothetical protein
MGSPGVTAAAAAAGFGFSDSNSATSLFQLIDSRKQGLHQLRHIGLVWVLSGCAFRP